MGRSGVIVHRERHHGGFDIVHVKDVLDRTFATRLSNIFVIGEGNKPLVSLPKGKGVKLSIAGEYSFGMRWLVSCLLWRLSY